MIACTAYCLLNWLSTQRNLCRQTAKTKVKQKNKIYTQPILSSSSKQGGANYYYCKIEARKYVPGNRQETQFSDLCKAESISIYTQANKTEWDPRYKIQVVKTKAKPEYGSGRNTGIFPLLHAIWNYI